MPFISNSGGGSSSGGGDSSATIRSAEVDFLNEANGYTDEKLIEANVYADSNLREAKNYADGKITEAEQYADEKSAEAERYADEKLIEANGYADNNLREAKNYTDGKITETEQYSDEKFAEAEQYADDKSAETLQSAKQYTDENAEFKSNKVAVSGQSTTEQYPNAKSVYDFVMDAVALIPSGGLKIPIMLDKESDLPQSGQQDGDFYYIQDMDISAPSHNGRAWWNSEKSTNWFTMYDYYQSMDGYSIVQTTGGKWEVSSSWLNGLIAGAVTAHNSNNTSHADIRQSVSDEVNRAKSVENAKQEALSTAQLNAVNSGVTAAKIAAYDGLQGNIDKKQDKLTATGALNLLTAPSNAGGQPATKPIADFVQTAGDQTVSGKKAFSDGVIVSGGAPNMLAAFDSDKKIVSSGISSANISSLYTIDYEKVTNGTITGEAWYIQATGEVTVRVSNTAAFSNGSDALALTFTKAWAKPPVKTYLVLKDSATTDNQHLYVNTSGQVYYQTTSTYLYAGAYTASWNTNAAPKSGVFDMVKVYAAMIPALAAGNNGASVTLPIPNTETIIGYDYEAASGGITGCPAGVFEISAASVKWTNICNLTVAANTLRLRVRTIAANSAYTAIVTSIPALTTSQVKEDYITQAKPYANAKLIGSYLKYNATNWWVPSYVVKESATDVKVSFIGNSGGALTSGALSFVGVYF